MNRIGFVDLDTSHPRSFVRRLNARDGARVTGVFDRGRKKGVTETEAFCREFGAQPFGSVAELAGQCDGVMVLSADWATHFDDVRTCLERGVPCYCDKPVFGTRAEMDAFLDIVQKTGTPFFGGSGWRWNEVTQAFHAETRNRPLHDALMIGQGEWFYYGIHAVDWLLGLLGPGADWVQHEVHGPGLSVASLGHRRGCTVRLILETAPDVGRRFWASVDGKDRFVTFGGEEIHNGVCGTFVDMIEAGRAPAPAEDFVESLRVMFALRESRDSGERVRVDAARGVSGIDSAGFVQTYGLAPLVG